MKGVVIDKGEYGYAYLRKLFSAIGNAQLRYNWLITDTDCFPRNPEHERLLSGESCWLSGRQLTDMVNEEDFQWIWAVLSGLPPDAQYEDALKHPLPFAEGNSAFWDDAIGIQHPLAEIEIVAFDSSETLFISQSDALANKVLAAYPPTYDLQESNRKTNAQIRRILALLDRFQDELHGVDKGTKPEWQVWRAVFKGNENDPSDQQIVDAIKQIFC